MTKRSPVRYFRISPEIIRLAVMLHVRVPLSLRNVEDLLHERGIGFSQETVLFWSDRLGPLFAAEICSKRVSQMPAYRWRGHPGLVFVRINGMQRYLWLAVNPEGPVIEVSYPIAPNQLSAH